MDMYQNKLNWSDISKYQKIGHNFVLNHIDKIDLELLPHEATNIYFYIKKQKELKKFQKNEKFDTTSVDNLHEKFMNER